MFTASMIETTGNVPSWGLHLTMYLGRVVQKMLKDDGEPVDRAKLTAERTGQHTAEIAITLGVVTWKMHLQRRRKRWILIDPHGSFYVEGTPLEDLDFDELDDEVKARLRALGDGKPWKATPAGTGGARSVRQSLSRQSLTEKKNSVIRV